MIYKGGEVDSKNYVIVNDTDEHAAQLKKWGEKSPVGLEKKVEKDIIKKDLSKESVADSDKEKKSEEKPRRIVRKKKANKKA